MITGGLIAHPIDAAGDMLRFYRDAVADVSDDLTVFAGLAHAPDGSGAEARGDGRLPHRLRGGGGARARAVQDVGRAADGPGRPDAVPGDEHAARRRLPDGSLNYWLSNFTSGLPDGLIDAAVERFKSVPSTMSAILFEHFHGAVTRVRVDATPRCRIAKQGGTCVLPSRVDSTLRTPTRTSRGRGRRRPRWPST